MALSKPLDLLTGPKTVRVEFMVTEELNREITLLATELAGNDRGEVYALLNRYTAAQAAGDKPAMAGLEVEINRKTAGFRAEAARVLVAEGAYALEHRTRA